MMYRDHVPNSKMRLSSLLRGSASGVLAAFVLASCSAPAPKGAVVGAAAPAATKVTLTEPDGASSPRHLHLLTAEQYLNTLGYVFGPDVRPEARFPPTERTDGLLQVGTSRAGVTETQVEVYQKTASTVTAMVIDPKRRTFLIPCTPKNDKAADKACASEYLTRVGRLLFRRPLTPEKAAEPIAHADESADKLKDFYAGLGVAIEEILVSPLTLFDAETTEPDPARPGHRRLDAYSLASRLSFFLWNSGPDDVVLKAAASGEIQRRKVGRSSST
jgi:hypothetical protein